MLDDAKSDSLKNIVNYQEMAVSETLSLVPKARVTIYQKQGNITQRFDTCSKKPTMFKKEFHKKWKIC